MRQHEDEAHEDERPLGLTPEGTKLLASQFQLDVVFATNFKHGVSVRLTASLLTFFQLVSAKPRPRRSTLPGEKSIKLSERRERKKELAMP